jgi:hypothetical protein
VFSLLEMKSMLKRLLIAAAVMVAGVQSTNASIISFSQADYLSMSSAFSGAGGSYNGSGVAGTLMTPGPGVGAYAQAGATPDSSYMSGLAGSNENLNEGGRLTYYASAGTLAALNAAISGGATSLRIIGWNDNFNDNWVLGLWIDDGSGPVEVSSMISAGGSAVFSLGLSGPLTGAGVFVDGAFVSGGDKFHASWSIPEPGSLAVWGLIGGLGLVCGRRRRLR